MKGLRFWAIDDDKIFKLITTKFFEIELPEYSLEFFFDAKLALEKLKKLIENKGQLPDFILLDIKMTGMSAPAFLNNCLDLSDSVIQFPKIIMVSSATSLLEINNFKNNKLVYNFWSKPLQKNYFDKLLVA